MTLEEFTADLIRMRFLKEAQRDVAPFMDPTKAEFEMDQGFQQAALRQPVPRLACPITAYFETEDDAFGLVMERVETWEAFTDGPFECLPVHGPHLFLLPNHNEIELTDMIAESIAKHAKK